MTTEQTPRSRGGSVLLIVFSVGVLALALYVGLQIIGVLYGIVMPPVPPLPLDSVENSHSSTDYGVDQWEYTTSADPCEVVLFYEGHGGVCQVAVGQCGRTGSPDVVSGAYAQCAGQTPFSIFNMRWSTVVYAGSGENVRLDVSRDVYWIGSGPSTTPQMRFDELSSSPNSTTEP